MSDLREEYRQLAKKKRKTAQEKARERDLAVAISEQPDWSSARPHYQEITARLEAIADRVAEPGIEREDPAQPTKLGRGTRVAKAKGVPLASKGGSGRRAKQTGKNAAKRRDA